MVSFLACEVFPQLCPDHPAVLQVLKRIRVTDRDAPGIYVVQMHYIRYKTVKLSQLSVLRLVPSPLSQYYHLLVVDS
jgi:hypothetical protein